jgi:hypothetical protein
MRNWFYVSGPLASGNWCAHATNQGWDISAKKQISDLKQKIGSWDSCKSAIKMGVNDTGPASRLGSKISHHDPSMSRANLIPFLARVPMQLQPVHAYWSWFKNGIQVSPHIFRRLIFVTGFLNKPMKTWQILTKPCYRQRTNRLMMSVHAYYAHTCSMTLVDRR